MKTAQKSYMEGNSFGKIIADGIGSFLTLGFFPNFAKSISDFLVPTAKSKLSNLEKELAGLESGTGDVMKYDTATSGLKGISRETEIKRVQKAIAEQKKLAGIEEKEKNETAMLRKAEKKYNTNLNKFLDEENKKLIKKRGFGFIDGQGQISGKSSIQEANALREKFAKEFGVSPMTKKDIAENLEKNTKRALKLEKDKQKEIELMKLNELKNPKKDFMSAAQKIALDPFGGAGMTINNNIVNSQQTDNSKSENKINQGKSIRNQSIPEQYLIATY